MSLNGLIYNVTIKSHSKKGKISNEIVIYFVGIAIKYSNKFA